MARFSIVQPQVSSGTRGMEMCNKVESKEQMRIERYMRLWPHLEQRDQNDRQPWELY